MLTFDRHYRGPVCECVCMCGWVGVGVWLDVGVLECVSECVCVRFIY